MPVPFGLGVGDFIAVANLAEGIIKSLNEVRGATAQYASLLELLRSMASSLLTITSFLAGSETVMVLRVDEAFKNGVCFHVECCYRLMSNFLLESKKYTETLFNGQGKRAKIAFRKVTWCMYRAEDAVRLEQRLQSHLDAIHRYLTTINIQQQARAAEKADMKVERLGRTKMLGYPWEGDMTSHVGFEDALGRKVVLPDVLCRSPQSFQETVKLMFTNHPGYCKILRGDYEIINADNGEILLRPSMSGYNDGLKETYQNRWKQHSPPGTRLAMNIIKRRDLESFSQHLLPTIPKEVHCPRCGWTNFGSGNRKCKNCDNLFKYTIVEYCTSTPRFAKDDSWPCALFSRKSTATDVPQFPELLRSKSLPLPTSVSSYEKDISSRIPDVTRAREIALTVESGGRSAIDNRNLAVNEEGPLFRRVHYFMEHTVPRDCVMNGFEYSRVPLIQAAAQGDARWVQELLLSSDIDPDMRSFQGWTALQQACSANAGYVEEVAKLLIKHGADINAAPGHGYSVTALQAACSGGRMPLVELLLDCGADINASPAGCGYTALDLACNAGHTEIVQLLLEHGAQVNEYVEPMSGYTTLSCAVKSGNMATFELLLDHGVDGSDAIALQTAVLYDHEQIVKRLIEFGTDVNALLQGPTYFILSAITAVALASSLGMIECLDAYGADINGAVCPWEGTTTIQYAAAYRSTEVLEKLLRLGGDVNAPPAAVGGKTALEAAAFGTCPSHVRLLVEKYGAVVNPAITSEKPHFSAVEVATFQAAKRGGRSTVTEPKNCEFLSNVEFLLERGAELTPVLLHMAAAWGNENLGNLLLKRGANPNLPPNSPIPSYIAQYRGDDRDLGSTVFETARLNARPQFLEFLESWVKVQGSHSTT